MRTYFLAGIANRSSSIAVVVLMFSNDSSSMSFAEFAVIEASSSGARPIGTFFLDDEILMLSLCAGMEPDWQSGWLESYIGSNCEQDFESICLCT